ncbi:TPA: hypothetical protein ACPUE9_001624 [Proteus mirabilis]|nr:hypothetical protein [Proteus mirabilis]MDM3648113.1 hypothetical protein [Proteus mirabilis]
MFSLDDRYSDIDYRVMLHSLGLQSLSLSELRWVVIALCAS